MRTALGRWGWVILVVVGVGMLVSGPVVVTQRPVVAGRVVSNFGQVLDDAAQVTLQRGATDPNGNRLKCYLAYQAPGWIACGPAMVTIDKYVWDTFPYSVKPDGHGGVILVPGQTYSGDLNPGTKLIGPDNLVGYVRSNQTINMHKVYTEELKVAVWLLVIAALWLMALPIIVSGQRRQRSRQLAMQHGDYARMRAERGWQYLAGLPMADAVVPPSPSLVEPATTHTMAPEELAVATTEASSGLTDRETPAAMWPAAAEAGTVDSIADSGDPITVEGDPDEVVEHRWSGPAVLVLGPVMVTGWSAESDRKVITELAAYLVCHQNRPRSAEEIQAAVWPINGGRKEVSIETVQQYMSRVRKAIGEEHLPDAGRSGYQFAGTVSSDWFRFQALADAARRAGPDRAISIRRDALGLVRGAPFAGVAKGTYGWAWDEFLVADMEALITEVAHQMAEDCLAAGQARLADWAAGRGLLAVRAEETLLGDRLAAAAELGGKAGLLRAWRDVRSILGEQADSGPVGELFRRLSAAVEARTPAGS